MTRDQNLISNMTVDPFRKHFRSVRLLRISNQVLNDHCKNEFKSLVMIEGRVMHVQIHEHLFTELLIQDDLTFIKIPVITFDNSAPFEMNEKLACIGFIHSDWLPDYRCTTVKPFKSALKAEIIKRQ